MKNIYICIALLIVGQASAVSGPSSPYYLTNGDASILQVGETGVIVDSWTTAFLQYPLAVVDTARVYMRDGSQGPGLEYTLTGTATGNTYPWQPGPTGQLLDGGTDGVNHNYASDWSAASVGGGSIWQYDRHWNNAVKLFDTVTPLIGVTYDQADDTLWISLDSGNIQQVDLAGNVLDEFYPGVGRWGALAWEPATDTLWAHQNGTGNIAQWSKGGTLLQTVTVPGLSNNIWGGEFQVIPEPTVIGMIGLASGCVVFVRRFFLI